MSPGRTPACILILLALLVDPAPAAAQDMLPGFVDKPVVTGLTVPVAFTTLPDGRILVAVARRKIRCGKAEDPPREWG